MYDDDRDALAAEYVLGTLSADEREQAEALLAIDPSFAEIVRAEARRIRLGMGVLATIGATSPFVGLFGTVWGIMNSFIGISKSQTTNLAVVAPGIAEALLATCLGLFAAIPAVMFYNIFQVRISAYGTRSEGFVAELMNAISRQLDKGA